MSKPDSKEPSARYRSPFGQFQLSQSANGDGVDYSKVIPKPRSEDMARMLREGKTLEEVAEAVGLTVSRIKNRLSESGYTRSGEVRKYK
jgi:DNA-binding NarL/FixJ family response regulator